MSEADKWTLAYFGIGFLVLVVCFIIIGPSQMWFMLNDRDPNEPAFGLFKTTTAERRKRDDDHFGAWLCVFFSLFLWPAMLVVLAAMALVHGMVYSAKWIAEKLGGLCRRKREVESEKEVAGDE